MTHPNHAYHATWILVPELSFYEKGDVPISGKYRISVSGDVVSFTINWVSNDGQEHTITFGGALDGEQHKIEQPPNATASYTTIDTHTLDSAMYVDGVQAAYARRIVSNDGLLMSVLQTGTLPDGTRFRNTQVYRKLEDA